MISRAGLIVMASMWLGCAHTKTRQVTAWFRVATHYPASTIIAESGGPHPYDTADHRVGDHWERVSDSASAMSIAGGARVLYVASDGTMRAADANGATSPYPCEGRVFTRGDGREILCLVFEAAKARDPDPVPVTVRWLDDGGRDLHAPFTVMLPRNPYPTWSERTFVGFVAGEPVMADENDRDGTDQEPFPGKECALYVLRPTGAIPLGKPLVVGAHRMYVSAAHEHCYERSVVDEALAGAVLERGRSTLDGSP